MIAGEIRRSGTRATPVVTADAAVEVTGSTLEGYASVFDRSYPVTDALGSYAEVVRRGAFAASLRSRTPIIQWSHGHDPAVGTAPIAELLQASEDSTGLYFRGRLFDAPALDLLREGLASGAINGASFRFQVPAGGDKWNTGRTSREIVRADVLELGPTVWPASPHTSVALRSKLRARTGRTDTPTPAGLSARARRTLVGLANGWLRWSDVPAALQLELCRHAPTRVVAATTTPGITTTPMRSR